MTDIDDLLAEISTNLAPAIVPGMNSALAASDLYEAYSLTLLKEAAETESGVVTFSDRSGNQTNTLVFRTSPGNIFSTAANYTHAVVAFPGQPLLEAHIGIKIQGRSGVLHECDVVVLRSAEAETCRQNAVHPRSHSVILATECKFYTGSIPLYLARAFMGLGSDISTDNCYFVTNSESGSAERLLAHHHRNWEHRIVPRLGMDVTRLRNQFQKAFKNFIALS